VRHGCDTGAPHVLSAFCLFMRKPSHRYSISMFRMGTMKMARRKRVRPHLVVTPNEVPISMPLRRATTRQRAPSALLCR